MNPIKTPVTVTILPGGQFRARKGDTLLDAALDNGIHLDHDCGGNCSCTTCHVFVVEGASNLSEIEEPERYQLQFATGVGHESRLACQALLRVGSVTIKIPD